MRLAEVANLPRVDNIERRIAEIEGFEVRILRNGANAYGNLELPVHYRRYEKRAADNFTVAEWKDVRFRPIFAGFDVQVLNGAGKAVPGQTTLRTVRQSYI
ncbi:MAG TPA: hypothetical protein VFX41_12050 [Actinomycetales bacterium]|jgi:hypothetical protein|nr:hypothetical protein [Actinomycetales bacterium]